VRHLLLSLFYAHQIERLHNNLITFEVASCKKNVFSIGQYLRHHGYPLMSSSGVPPSAETRMMPFPNWQYTIELSAFQVGVKGFMQHR